MFIISETWYIIIFILGYCYEPGINIRHVYLYQRIVIRNFVYDRPCWVRIDVILLKLRDILLSRFISVLCIICLINDNKSVLVLLPQNISVLLNWVIFFNSSSFMIFYPTFINSSLSGILAITGRVELWLI